MTGLIGNTLVPKNHPRIQLRGKLDSLQAQVILAQCDIASMGANSSLLSSLQELLPFLQQLSRAEVLDVPFTEDTLFGLSLNELREQSHNTKKYFDLTAMTLPDYHFGKIYALLNALRAKVRETELAAVAAFMSEEGDVTRPDLLLALNRLSSAIHVLMCRELCEKES